MVGNANTSAPTAPSVARGRRRALTAEAQAEFVDAIYAATTDPQGWRGLFAQVERHLGGHSTIYERCTRDPRSHRLAAASLDPAFADLYNGYYNATNLWATSPMGGELSLYVTEEVLDGGALERTEFYADWLRPQGLKHGLSCRVGGAGGRSLHLGLVREPKYGVYEQDELQFFEGLKPHLCRAVEIAHRLGEAEAQADGAFEALGRRNVAAFLVDARGVVHGANAAAERLLSEGRGLTLRSGRLAAGSASDEAALRRVIARGTGEGLTAAGRTGDIVYLGGGDPGRALSIAAVPLQERHRPFGLGHGPLAMLTVSRPADRIAPTADRLRRRYDLTPAEARLAIALCAGASIAGYAGETGTSPTTVKTHLQALFGKVGENRQVDLIRRLMADAVAEAA